MYGSVTIDGVWIEWLNLLTTYTQYSELQAPYNAIHMQYTRSVLQPSVSSLDVAS
jgi:hypothetical protein